MIEQYWEEMFGDFKVGKRQYAVPGFDEPLISADFANRNIVGARGVLDHILNFKLCLFQAKGIQQETTVKIEALGEAIKNEAFWDLQRTHNESNYSFMQRFLSFLAGRPHEYFHFYIEQQGRVIASMVGGNAVSGMLFFNASVAREYRKQGLSRELIRGGQSLFYNKPSFFWTSHSWFTLAADEVLNYFILPAGLRALF